MKFFYFFIFICFSFYLFSQDLNKDLIKSSKEGDYDKVVNLISNGADVNYIGEFRWTPLMWAVRNNYKNIVEYLLKNGAILDLKGSAKDVASIARENGFDNLSKLLLSQQAIYNNIEEESDEKTKDYLIRTPILSLKDQKGLAYFRVFAKVENKKLFFAIGLKYLNKKQENIGGIAYSDGRKFSTFSKKMTETMYLGEHYFVEYYTIIIDPDVFLNLLDSKKDLSFGIRRSKYDFDFVVPLGMFKAIYKKAIDVGMLKKDIINEINDELKKNKKNNLMQSILICGGLK